MTSSGTPSDQADGGARLKSGRWLMERFPFFAFLVAFCVWGLLIAIGTTELFRIPNWGVTFHASERPNEIVASRIWVGGEADIAGIAPGDRFVALIRSRDNKRLDITPSVLMKYRAEAKTYAEWEQVLSDKAELWSFQREDLWLVKADGTKILMSANRLVGFNDLPLRYFLMATLSLAILAVSAGILAFAPPATGSMLAAIAGMFLSGILLYQALISSIRFAVPPLLLDMLYFLGAFGAVIYTFTVTAMIWHTPRPLARTPFATLWLLTATFVFVSNHFSLVTFPFNPFIFPMLAANAVGLLLLGMQIVRARNDPVDRATVSWFTLSLLAGGLPYLFLVLMPRAFNLAPLIPVEGGVILLLLTWGGFVFGTLRYRLFSIQAVWFTTMLWLSLVGIFAVADVLLIVLFGLGNIQAFTIAAVLTSWMLFPLKGLFLDHLWRRNLVQSDEVALQFVDMVGSMDEPEEMDGRFLRFVQSLFKTESAEIHGAVAENDVRIQDRGLSLRYPAITREGSVILRGRTNGHRLFTPNDAKVLRLLYKMARRMYEQRQHQDARRLDDRNRIARDLHDHLGARLLNLLFAAPEDSPIRSATSSAIDALKESIMVLEDSEVLDLETCLKLIWSEQEKRLSAGGFSFLCETSFNLSRIVDSRTFVNLKNILEELVSNAIKYGDRGKPVLCSASILKDGTLCIRVENHVDDIAGAFPSGGRGMHNMKSRAGEIGALIRVFGEEEPGELFAVELELPLTN